MLRDSLHAQPPVCAALQLAAAAQRAAPSHRPLPQAVIGGPFDLLDQDGQRFTDKDLLGRFALLYFGFTWCPDICPEELEKIAAATDQAGERSSAAEQERA